MARLLLTADAVGGVWQYATDLARGLVPFGHEVVLATMGPALTDTKRAAVADLDLVETGLPLDWLAAGEGEVRLAARRITELAGDLGVDLVQLHTPAFVAPDCPVPTVAVLHSCVLSWWDAVEGGAAPDDFGWRSALVGRGLRAAACAVAPSAALAGAAQRLYALPSAPAVVHNGRRPVATGAGKLHDYAFTAGRLWDRGKDATTLDAAAGLLGVPLKAAGPLVGANGEAFRPDHLVALGELDEAGLARFLAERPVFVSAARYEPFGLAVLEAAQAGCALVLADIATFRELWDGVALFVEPRHAKGFANAVTGLIDDPDWRLQLGDAARARAAAYSVEAMAAGMAALYAPLLARRSVAA